MTICHVSGKPNVIADALSHHSDLAAVIGLVEFGLLSPIREAQVAACGDSWEQLKKAESTCEHGFMFFDSMLIHT